MNEKNWLGLLGMNEITFSNIPKEAITEEICNLALNQDCDNWNFIPEEFLTKKIRELFFNKCYCSLYILTEDMLTKEMC